MGEPIRPFEDYCKQCGQKRRLLTMQNGVCELCLEAENAKLRARVAELEVEIKSYRAFRRSVDEALNSGDGSYRP